MKPSEILFNETISNRDKFGLYVRERRRELCLTQRDLAKSLDLTPAYVSDVEKGNRSAPLKHLNQIAILLKIDQDEIDYFFDIASCTHSNWPEINEYLFKTPNARKAIRLARDKNMSEQEFLNYVSNMAKEQTNEF